MRSSLITLVLILLSTLVRAQTQEYRFKLYRVEQGLPSDVIKAVAEDTLNFIWIATDDGLVKYDGLLFTTYKAALKSQYTKAFLKTRDGRLLAIGDLDLIEIQNKLDTVIFKPLLSGTRLPTDSTISAPKSVYEDSRGTIWLGEPQAVVRYNGKPGSLTRFELGEANRSPVFIRSFTFFEDSGGNLFTVAYNGNTFRYDELLKDFVPVRGRLPYGVNHAMVQNGQLLVATNEGVFEVTLEDLHIAKVNPRLPTPKTSYLVGTADGTWVGTYDQELYHLRTDNVFGLEVLDYSFKGINSVYRSSEGDLWVATDKGLVLVQKNFFLEADINSEGHFIEGIAHDAAHDNTYYCTKESLVVLKPGLYGTPMGSRIYFDPKAYFQALQFGKAGLWACSAENLLLFRNDKLVRTWNFQQSGNFVHDIYLDKNNNLWLCQAGNTKLTVIDTMLQQHSFDVPVPKLSEINLVREGNDGMYVAATGKEGYLFFKPYNSDKFNNISLPVTFAVQGDFNVVDLAILGNDVWIASTEGLLRYDRKTINRVELGEVFTTFSVSSVEVLDDHHILFANSYGLFCYDTRTNEYWLYDENSGLPSNAITDHGIFVDDEKRVWVGTSYGLAYTSNSLTENRPTTKPYCVGAQVGGHPVRYVHGVRAPYGAFVNIQFSPITFPENKITLQWRLREEGDVWHKMDYHEVSLSSLGAGEHKLEVRAKKNTGLGWSDITTVAIFVSPPFWQKPEFIMLVLCTILLISWASYSVASRINRNRKEFLQNLVDKRTQELQKANDELVVRNNELDRFVYSASHDLSAPLKSILGLIRVSRLDNPNDTHAHYLTMMERSVLKLEEFIKDVVSYSRNTRMPVKMEVINFAELVKGILHDLQYSPNFARIQFNITDSTDGPLVSDTTRVRIILNNLVSNAIKFHNFDEAAGQQYVDIALARANGHYTITVKDNGQGIEDKHVSRIFEMFYRGTEGAQGSGLGLYILKETVAKLGGTVAVQSEFGCGTTFTITLAAPATRADAKIPQPIP